MRKIEKIYKQDYFLIKLFFLEISSNAHIQQQPTSLPYPTGNSYMPMPNQPSFNGVGPKQQR